ncbi:InlB B-repeat-containing protein [Thermoguttaceae bacterium LCP21S3_D4]
MPRFKKGLSCILLLLVLLFSSSVIAYADDIGDTGDTDQGDVTGLNVYTFYYSYDSSLDAIVLTVRTKNPINGFGNTCSHTFSSPSDTTVLNTSNPQLGSSLESAIATMNSVGGYNLSASDAKAKLNALGYYDSGNGIWKYNGGYLTYVSAVKIRPQKHTVHYDANGGSGAPGDQTKNQGVTLTLSSKKPSKTGYTFKYWNASIGGTYYPGSSYTHDQDGGTVTMKAYWKDETSPSCSSFSAVPNYWSAGNGSVSFTVQDEGSGLASVTLQRYSDVTKTWSTVKTWSYNGTTSAQSGTYTETAEGVFCYRLIIKDKVGNTTTKVSACIYLDHSNPVIYGVENTVTDWTNVAPVISVSGTDYLIGTTYTGSGLGSIVIKDDSGNIVASGVASTSYTLVARYEGIHTWYITATDNVGHTSSRSVTTKYDCTKPGIDGTEITYVTPDGITVSGYCQDNIINQHIDDEIRRSPNGANASSGLKSVILYRVTGGNREVIYGDRTKSIWNVSDTHSWFDMYYEITADEKMVDYYEIIVTDFAGNRTKKKLTSQYSLLTWFHTSIDRSSYN